ncbi:hypothetical protein C8R46DRAFT_1198168, partial [Mycena filopes]
RIYHVFFNRHLFSHRGLAPLLRSLEDNARLQARSLDTVRRVAAQVLEQGPSPNVHIPHPQGHLECSHFHRVRPDVHHARLHPTYFLVPAGRVRHLANDKAVVQARDDHALGRTRKDPRAAQDLRTRTFIAPVFDLIRRLCVHIGIIHLHDQPPTVLRFLHDQQSPALLRLQRRVLHLNGGQDDAGLAAVGVPIHTARLHHKPHCCDPDPPPPGHGARAPQAQARSAPVRAGDLPHRGARAQPPKTALPHLLLAPLPPPLKSLPPRPPPRRPCPSHEHPARGARGPFRPHTQARIARHEAGAGGPQDRGLRRPADRVHVPHRAAPPQGPRADGAPCAEGADVLSTASDAGGGGDYGRGAVCWLV